MTDNERRVVARLFAPLRRQRVPLRALRAALHAAALPLPPRALLVVDAQNDFAAADARACYAWRAAHEPGADATAIWPPSVFFVATIVQKRICVLYC